MVPASPGQFFLKQIIFELRLSNAQKGEYSECGKSSSAFRFTFFHAENLESNNNYMEELIDYFCGSRS